MREIIFFILCLCGLNVFSQELTTTEKVTSKKGNFYFSWGYTRAWFSKSDIHFEDKSNNYHDYTKKTNFYDFTIYDAKAKDRPDFDKLYDVINITVPQFVWRIGYFFNDKHDLGLELSFDHTKYIVRDFQRVHIKGQFNGNIVDKDTTLDPASFLHFEHSDGANFLMGNFVKRWKFWERSEKFNIGWVVKGGAGVVIPRTDVTLFGERLNNRFHVAGIIAGSESGLRIEFLKHGSFEFMAKGTFANYMKVLVLGKGNGNANHTFFTGQLNATIGFMIGGKRRSQG